ncbi:MAG: hypothetical protein IT236_03040 [Bacteroidia bacterium]|nr:hypothetical protein [Bacteroidia bacterium]
MKKLLGIFILVIALASTSSCKKKLASGDLELVGTWTDGYTTDIQINSNGSGYSHYDDGSSYKNIDGKVIVSGDVITIKALGAKEEYTINKRPYTKNGKTQMDLNGDVYTKN